MQPGELEHAAELQPKEMEDRLTQVLLTLTKAWGPDLLLPSQDHATALWQALTTAYGHGFDAGFRLQVVARGQNSKVGR